MDVLGDDSDSDAESDRNTSAVERPTLSESAATAASRDANLSFIVKQKSMRDKKRLSRELARTTRRGVIARAPLPLRVALRAVGTMACRWLKYALDGPDVRVDDVEGATDLDGDGKGDGPAAALLRVLECLFERELRARAVRARRDNAAPFAVYRPRSWLPRWWPCGRADDADTKAGVDDADGLRAGRRPATG